MTETDELIIKEVMRARNLPASNYAMLHVAVVLSA